MSLYDESLTDRRTDGRLTEAVETGLEAICDESCCDQVVTEDCACPVCHAPISTPCVGLSMHMDRRAVWILAHGRELEQSIRQTLWNGISQGLSRLYLKQVV